MGDQESSGSSGNGRDMGNGRVSPRRGLGYGEAEHRPESPRQEPNETEKQPSRQHEQPDASKSFKTPPVYSKSTIQGPRRNQKEPQPENHASPGAEATLKLLHDVMIRAMDHPPKIASVVLPPQQAMITAMRKMGTTHFAGGPDPFEADKWLRMMEKNFAATMCPDEYKVGAAIYFLEDMATEWWDSRARQVGHLITTWEAFKTEFEHKYFTKESQRRLQKQFANLEQGGKTVREYEAEFMKLRRHVLHGRDDEDTMITNFLFGLRPELESRLAVGNFNSLTELVEKAVNVEIGLDAEKAARKERMNQGEKQNQGQGQTSKQNQDEWKDKNRQNMKQNKEGPPQCYRCNKIGHISKYCTESTRQDTLGVTCYACGQTGHFASRCPRLYPNPIAPVAVHPPPARPAIEQAPKRQTIGGRVYALVEDTQPPGPVQGPVTG